MKEQMKFKNSFLPKNSYEKPHSLKDFIRHIDLNKSKLKKIEALLHGYFQSVSTGSGFDFNEIREYKIGDDLRHISWSTTAKTGALHTKEYYAEKEVRSYFLIDVSSSMFCGNKLEPFIQIFAFLLNLSISFSEKIGGVFFSDDIKCYFPLSQANSQANIMFETLLDIAKDPKNKTFSPLSFNTNLYKALEFTKKSLCKKGLIYILSDFVNLTGWEKSIFQASQNQNIYSFQIYDPIDFNLPKSGYITIIDPETKERCIVNTDNRNIQEAYSNEMKQKQEKLKKFLKSIGIEHLTIEKDDFYAKL